MHNTWRAVLMLGALFGLAASPAQGPEIQGLMREKLVHAQKILEAVVTSDWVNLETESRTLEQLTKDPRWMVLKYPEYAKYSEEFVQTVQDLRRAAAQRDLDKTPKAYVAVTMQCVECHRYLARARVASRGGR
jgi:hypothetical protein